MSFGGSKAFSSHNLNVQPHQSSHLPKAMKTEWVTIPSQSTPSYGSQFQLIVNGGKPQSIDDAYLMFYLSALTATDASGGTVAYAPIFFHASKIEILVGSTVIDTVTGLGAYLENRTFTKYEDITYLLGQSGNDSSISNLNSKSSSASYWLLPLWTVFKQASVPLVTAQDITLRVYMNTLANIVVSTSGSTTGTPSASITSCSLLAKLTTYNQSQYASVQSLIRRNPLSFLYTEERAQSWSISSGVSTYTAVLSGITGYISHLWFLIRTSSQTNYNNYTAQSVVSSFEILDSAGTNIIGGSAMTSTVNRYIVGQVTPNTYLADATNGQVFFYNFASDPMTVAHTGQNMGGFHFRGSEQLKLTFSSSTSAAYQLDVIAHAYASLNLQQGTTPVKLSLTNH